MVIASRQATRIFPGRLGAASIERIRYPPKARAGHRQPVRGEKQRDIRFREGRERRDQIHSAEKAPSVAADALAIRVNR